MTRKELVKAIEPDAGLPMSNIDDVLVLAMKNIMQTLEKGESVYLRGFGTFSVKRRAEKKARNISRNKEIIVPARNIPHFKPSKDFQVKQ